jgi:urease accessory protein UreF
MHSKATIEKIRKARTGKKHSAETKAKIQAAMLERAAMIKQGLLPAFKHSDATKAKMRKSALKRKVKPTKKALKASAESRKSRAEARKVGKALTRNPSLKSRRN